MIRADLRGACAAVIVAAVTTGSAAAAPVTVIVSVGSSERAANGPSRGAAVSGDGGAVAFVSSASNLTRGERDEAPDVFVRDLGAGRTTWVSSAAGGDPSRTGVAGEIDITDDGSAVAFRTSERLVGADGDRVGDVYLRTVGSPSPELVSLGASGGALPGPVTGGPSLSGDGRFVGFVSPARIHRFDRNRAADVFLKDRRTGNVALISVDSGELGSNAASGAPDVSGTGRHVAFASTATDLTASDVNAAQDVFVRDRTLKDTRMVSVSTDGRQADGRSWAPAISGDGRYVAFTSDATNLVASDTNGVADVFVHDTVTGATVRVSVDSEGGEWTGPSAGPALSFDGRYVVFETAAPEVGAAPGARQVVVHDIVNGVTQIASASGTTAADGDSAGAAISSDGISVAFHSSAADLVDGDANSSVDVFLTRWSE